MEFMLQNDQDEQEQNSTGAYAAANKVMTDEQIEILRKQISVYSTISQQLVQLHKQQQQQHLLLATTTDGIFYSDPSIALGHRINSRQRWTPTPVQLQVLEQLFDQGNGTPTKQKIKEIADDLSKHGLISETNVYNWFQNRRARSKRKQLAAQPSSNDGQQEQPEIEVDSSSSRQNNTKPEMIHQSSSFQNLVVDTDESLYLEEYGTDLHCQGDDHMFPLEEEHHHLISSTSMPDSKLCFHQPGDQFHMLG